MKNQFPDLQSVPFIGGSFGGSVWYDIESFVVNESEPFRNNLEGISLIVSVGTISNSSLSLQETIKMPVSIMIILVVFIFI